MTLVIAHQGASRAEPGNTLAAFRAAARLGADMVELDVRRTADGALAVHHDAGLADGRPLVALQAADLPPWLPLLDDALEACAGMGVNVEIKNHEGELDFDEHDRIADLVVERVVARRAHDQVLVSSFNLATVDRVRALSADVATAWLVMAVDETVLDRCVRHGHTTLHPFQRVVDADVVSAAHAAGLTVNTWTVDDPQRIRDLAGAGVDGIVTNVPDVALSVLGRR